MTEFVNKTNANTLVPVYLSKIVQWHYDRNLIEGSTDPIQFMKLISELGELASNLAKKRNIADDIGDAIVVLVNIAERNGLSIEDCLKKAWDDIKDRKGMMIDGTFVKESDLAVMKAEDSNM